MTWASETGTRWRARRPDLGTERTGRTTASRMAQTRRHGRPRLKISSRRGINARLERRDWRPGTKDLGRRSRQWHIRWTAIDCCVARQQGGVYVVPIWELTRDVESSPAMRVLASRGTKPVSAVWWYRRLEPERADPVVAICVGADGEVRAWDVAKGSPLGACVVGAKCANAELARGKSSQFLVINGFDGEVWTLMLERMARVVKSSTVNKGKVETSMVAESLPDAAGTHDFAAHAHWRMNTVFERDDM